MNLQWTAPTMANYGPLMAIIHICINVNILVLCTVCLSLIKRKRPRLRNQLTCDMSPVHPDHPRCHSATRICTCGHTHDIVIYSKFHRNPFRGFGAAGDRNLHLPITLAIGFFWYTDAAFILHSGCELYVN